MGRDVNVPGDRHVAAADRKVRRGQPQGEAGGTAGEHRGGLSVSGKRGKRGERGGTRRPVGVRRQQPQPKMVTHSVNQQTLTHCPLHIRGSTRL